MPRAANSSKYKNASQANELKKTKPDLEARVLERTEELINMIAELTIEIAERDKIEQKLHAANQELETRNRYEKILRAVTQSVHQSLALQEVLQNAVESICVNIGTVEHASIFLVEGREALMRAHMGHPDWFISRIARIPYPKGFTWKTIIEGKPIYCSDVDKDAVIGPAGKKVGTKSYASMPLHCEGNTIGTINVHSLLRNAFNRAHIKLFNDVAEQIEIAINNANQAEALRNSEERYWKLIEQTNDWVWETDPDGCFTYVSQKIKEITGYEPDELIGKTIKDVMLPEEAIKVSELIYPMVSAQEPFKRIEKRIIHKDGEEAILEVSGTPMYDGQGYFKGYLGVVEDITQRRNQEKKIHHYAMHDYLTDLPNRRFLEEELVRLTNQNNSKQNSALAVIDLDNFKLINDTLGHIAGDQLLKDLSHSLARIVRPEDLLARMGGDEFAVLLQNVSQTEAKKIVQRLFKSINEYQFKIKGYDLHLNWSIGITFIDCESSIEDILQKAYAALSQAKTDGKNRIINYIAAKNKMKTKRDGNWNHRIKKALNLDQYTIDFQPVVRLDNGKTEFFEALIRMKADNGHIVFPNSFIHVAERLGLMPEIDRWMVKKITTFLGRNPSATLSINLSGTSLRDKALLSLIERYIKEGRMSADQLVFEITEISVIRDLSSVRKWMNKLQTLNSRFALDDFGTGFSSFKHLQMLPVDFVKIDVAFVSKIKSNPSCYAIVESIASVAHTLGKEVIAEGVENQDIIKVLREFKIELGQGKFWKSKNLHSLKQQKLIF
jgi:diguanylate cyclase (GGDEF)-like protein/PAS domain S-box-containing protein